MSRRSHRWTRNASSVSLSARVATLTIRQTDRQSFLSRNPTRATDPPIRPGRFQGANLGDHIGIVASHREVVEFVEDPPPGFDPVRLCLEFLGLDKRRRPHVVEHFPIAGRLSIRFVNRVSSMVVSRSPIVLFSGEMSGANIQAGNRRGPIS